MSACPWALHASSHGVGGGGEKGGGGGEELGGTSLGVTSTFEIWIKFGYFTHFFFPRSGTNLA